MKMEDAIRLNNAWKAAHPGETCSHPDFEKEQAFNGAGTGDRVCTTCGEAMWYTEANEILAARKRGGVSERE